MYTLIHLKKGLVVEKSFEGCYRSYHVEDSHALQYWYDEDKEALLDPKLIPRP